MKKKAVDTQVGGDHYKKLGYQPIELIHKLGLDFFQGNMLKYITRYKYKNGQEDLDKCIHYAKLAYELGPKDTLVITHKYARPIEEIIEEIMLYKKENKLSNLQTEIILAIYNYNMKRVIYYTKLLIAGKKIKNKLHI